MNWIAYSFMLFTCIASEWVLRPWLGLGLASVDLPVLFVLWLAQQVPKRWALVMALALSALRATFGIDSIMLCAGPLIASASLLWVVRGAVNLRELYFRTVWTSLATGLYIWLDGGWRLGLAESDPLNAVIGAGATALAVPLFFPILDACLSSPRSTR
ncbi:MAG: hypothetical protein ACKVX7_02485 [Planctomycetota bacterium]